METFADYILEEKDLASKMEIAYYLSKKTKIFFDKSVILKTEIAKMFIDYAKIDVDKNLVLTACILYNCKKIDNAQDFNSIQTYAKKGAQYLENLGFNKRFCKICEEFNRYTETGEREKESDILELVDNFGGMLLDRPERIGFRPDEAIVLLEHRNLKNKYNRYLKTFIEFVNFIEKINMPELTSMTALRRLIKIYNDTEDVKDFIKKVVYDYENKVNKLIAKRIDNMAEKMLKQFKDTNRPLFSEETAKKIMSHMNEKEIAKIKE